MMSIKQWPKNERPRDKLVRQGSGQLSNVELMAIVLGVGSKGRTAIDIARALLVKHGGLRAIFNEPVKNLCEQPGIGISKAIALHAALELGRRIQQERMLEVDALTSPRQCEAYLLAWLKDRPYECFVCIFLDNKNQILCCEELFHGTIDQVTVYPREVARISLEKRASAVIVAHNHPSGVAEPSQSDISITGRLHAALDLLDIRLLDHMIIGDSSAISLAERGYL